MPLSFEANAGQTDSRVKFLSRGAGYTLFLTGDEAVLALKKSGVRSQESEAGRSKLGFGNSKFEIRKSKMEIGNWKFENRNPKFENRSSKSDDRKSAIGNRQSAIETAIDIPRPLIPNLEAPIRVSEARTSSAESSDASVLRLKLWGANPAAKVTGAEELPGKANYFIGNDPKKWHTNVPTYAKVKYQNVYPGVDLVYYGSQGGQLEYDFVVAPGADAGAIALEVGAGLAPAQGRPQGSPLQITAEGDLVIPTAGGQLRFHKPIVYQEQDSGFGIRDSGAKDEARNSKFENRKSTIENRQSVEARFVLDAENRVHFALGPYDHTRPLVIDPVLVYSTYLGGSGGDGANGIAVDSSGNAYVTGGASSPNFPTANPYQASLAGYVNAFVTKLNWDASTSTLSLVYSTYLGGSGSSAGGDSGNGIAVDSSGNAYVTGETGSSNFPTAHPLQASLAGIIGAFVAELNSTGSALVYSTYLGGSGTGAPGDGATGIAVDSSGNAYVTGRTTSSDFPTAHPLQASLAGEYNEFVSKLNWAASTSTLSLVYSTYLGGSRYDEADGIAVDSSDNAYVTGWTSSSNFPTAHPLQASLAGETNAVVSKLNWDASTSTLSLVYSTYLGGNNVDYGDGIAVDSSDNAYVAGWTASTNFPTAHPIQARRAGIENAFVSELNWDASTSTLSLVYSTYLGGSAEDRGNGIAVDSSGNAYVTGYTASIDFPTASPLQASLTGAYNVFVSKLNWAASTSTLSLVYSTYLGGSSYDWYNVIAVDSSGNAYVAGLTDSSNFPTASPLQTSLAGYANAFVAKIGPANSPGIAFGPGALTFGDQGLGLTSAVQSVRLTAAGSQPLNVSSVTPSGDFALATTATSCPYSGGTVPSASTCTLDVTFTPTALGTRTGSLSVEDNASGSPQTVPLSGTGIDVPAATLSPTSLSFGSQAFRTTSTAEQVILTSSGTANLGFSSITFVGTNPGDFAQTNNCPGSMAPGTKCTISVTFTPSVLGGESATLDVNDSAAGSPQTVGLSGTGVADATLAPASYNFANVAIKTPSNPETFTLMNNESTALNISSIGFTGANSADFSQSSTCGTLPTSLAAGASCTLSVTFTPSVLGAESATLTVNDNAPAPYNTLTSALSGAGVADATLTPASYNFANVAIKTPSSAQIFTLQNNELTALNISSIGFTGANSGDFSQTGGTCGTLPTSLAAGASCTLSVTFIPSVLGAESATLTVNDNAPAPYNTLTSALSGAGVADATLTPASYNFANVAIKTPSNPETFTLMNNESTALNISSIGFTGANSADFSQTGGTCGAAPTSLAAGASCTLSVTFTPSVLGAESATLTVNDNAPAPYNTLTSALSGAGVVDATLTLASYNFANVAIKTPSSAQIFTLQNNELTALNISSIGFTGANSGDFSQTGGTCGTAPTSLAAGASCTIGVTLTPSVLGFESATLTVNDNAQAPYNTLTSALSGTGVADATLQQTSYDFGNVAVKTPSSAQIFTLHNNESTALNISSIGFTGANSADFSRTGGTCGTAPTSLGAGESCTISVTLTPSVLGLESATLTINDNAPAPYNTLTSALSGAGVGDATLQPASYNFANVAIKTPSNPETFTLQNNLLTALNISSIGFTGANSADFSQTVGTCGTAPTSLGAGASCTLSVTFTPSLLGLESASLTVNDNAPAPYNTLTSALSGTGVADATLAPASYSFQNVAIKTPSNAHTFTLMNNELTALNISSIGFTGADGGDFAQTGGTCGTAPTSLGAGDSCTISVTLTPSVLGLESATLTINDNAPAPYNTLTSALSGAGVADAALTPTAFSFRSVFIKTPSNPETFTLMNNESTALNISSIGFTGANGGDFSQTGGTCGTAPTSLAAGASCTISVTFTPSVLGAESATFTINDNAPAPYNALTSALSGAGVADATLWPTAYDFHNVAINTPSNAQTFTLKNNESTALNISSIGFTGANGGDFSQTGGTCGTAPTSLAAGESCTISVTLTPSVLGAESATFTINDNAPAPYNTLTSALGGAGLADATLTRASLDFGNVGIKRPSSPGTFTLQNDELTALNISSIGFTGANGGDFSQTGGTCGTAPTSLAAGKSCTIGVTLTPSVLGLESASLTVNDNAPAPYNTLTSALSGAGVADATLWPTSYSFQNVAIKTPSSAQTFTLKNNESTALNISSIGFTGANGGDFSQTGGTCGTAPTSLAAGESCTISVTLTPSVLGAESATFTINDNAPAPYNTLTSPLSGSGVADATLTPISFNFGKVALHTPSSAKIFTLQNNELTALNISSIGFTGANGGDFSQTGGTCGTAPTSLAAGKSCTIGVTFTPSTLAVETATLTVSDNAAAVQYQTLTSALSGAGVADTMLWPASYSFRDVAIDTPSNSETFTLRNRQLTALNISSIGFTGANSADFSQTGGTCGTAPTSLAAGESCTISVTLTPSVLGAESATFTINDNAPAPYNVLTSALSATSVADAALTPISYDFGNVAIKEPSNALTFTLKNNELTALNISSIGFTGANGGDFSQTGGTCGTAPTSLAAGKSCTIGVTFTPSTLAVETATLTVDENAPAPYNVLTSALSGGGVADATLWPGSYYFGRVAVHTASTAESFILKNNQSVTLNIHSIGFTGANGGDFSQTGGTCGTAPTSLAAGTSCTITVAFTPSGTGAESATMTVNDDAPAPYNTLTSRLTGGP
jgi:hypothetical protein